MRHIKPWQILIAGLMTGLMLALASPRRAHALIQPGVTPYCSAVGGAGAQVTATCPASTAGTGMNYVWEVSATCSAPASTVSGNATVVSGSTTLASYEFVEPAGGQPELFPVFPPLPASATNTSIVFTVPAISSGGACVACIYCSEQ